MEISLSKSGWTKVPRRPFWFLSVDALDEARWRMGAYFLYAIFTSLPDSGGFDVTSWNYVPAAAPPTSLAGAGERSIGFPNREGYAKVKRGKGYRYVPIKGFIQRK
jgi:hypothetical protein